MLCILYVIAISTLLGTAALLLERVLPAGLPRRWIWCGAIVLSMTIPPVYQALHHVEVSGLPLLHMYHTTLMRAWLIASVVLLVWGLAAYWRVSHVVRLARRARPGTEVDGVPVLVTDAAGPATVGVWRARVLIPRWVLGLPEPQRQYVLQHEEEHRRAHDGRLLFFSSLLLLLVPWNIALWWQLRRLSLAIELDCDDRVVSALGNADVYGELLFKVAEASSGPRMQPAFIGGTGMLERRLRSLLVPETLPRVLRYVLPAVAIVLVYVVLTTPHPMLMP